MSEEVGNLELSLRGRKQCARQTSKALMHPAKGWFFGLAGAQWSPGGGQEDEGSQGQGGGLGGSPDPSPLTQCHCLSGQWSCRHIASAQKAFAE